MGDVTTNKVYILMKNQYKTNLKSFMKIGAELTLRKKELDICEKKLAVLEGRHNLTQLSGSMVRVDTNKSTGRSLRQSSTTSRNQLFNAAEAAVKKCKKQSGFGYYY
jgi:hypothetical protein